MPIRELALTSGAVNDIESKSQELSRPRVAALTCGALASAIALVDVGRPSYWWDEAASISAAKRSVGQLVGLLHHIDLVHGLYYFFLHFWIEVFGTSEVSLRTPSAVALGVAVAGLVFIARRLSTTRAMWIVGLTAAVLPGLAWSGTEAREWAMVTAAVTWATYALILALESGKRRTYAAYFIIMALALALSVMSILMLAVHLWLARGRRRAPMFACIAVGLCAVASPLLVATYTQRGQVSWIHLQATSLFEQVAFNQLFLEEQNRSYGLAPFAGVVLCLVFLGLAAVALAGRRSSASLGALWVAIPTVLLSAPVLLGVQMYQARYLTYTAPGACLLIAEGLDLIVVRFATTRSARLLTGVALAVTLGVTAIPLVAQHQVNSKSGDDYRDLAAMARGASQVFYGDAAGRGIAISYPRDFIGVGDPLLRFSPASSETLFGVDARIVALKPTGTVVAYLFRGTKAPSALRSVTHRCVLLQRLVAARWVAMRFRCHPSPIAQIG